MLPARVSHSRRRYPFRLLVRWSDTSPYPAPHSCSTSASIICCAILRTIVRSRSGLADARVSSNISPSTGTMSPTAISFLSFVVLVDLKDHEMAVSRHGDTPTKERTRQNVTQGPYTTPVDVNDSETRSHRRRAELECAGLSGSARESYHHSTGGGNRVGVHRPPWFTTSPGALWTLQRVSWFPCAEWTLIKMILKVMAVLHLHPEPNYPQRTLRHQTRLRRSPGACSGRLRCECINAIYDGERS